MASAAVGDDTDLGRRVGAMDSRPDPDARYRVAEFFCRAAFARGVICRAGDIMAGSFAIRQSKTILARS
jgi:hypothetical protein